MAVVVEPLMLIREVQSCRSSWISSHGGEVFRGIVEVRHLWHIRLTNLTNTSQATKYLVHGDCKSESPRRNDVSSLKEPFGMNQRQIILTLLRRVSTGASYRVKLGTMLHTLGLERLEEFRVKLLLHLQLLGFRSNWEQSSSILIWRGWDKIIKTVKALAIEVVR
jgi:hypothetical protein